MRKIFYIPGIISAIGFLFILPYAYKKMRPTPIRAISLYVLGDPSPYDDPEYTYSSQTMIDELKRKKIIRVFLDGDQKTDQKKIDLVRTEARRLKYTYESNSAILIEFTDSLKYGEFVKILDNCKTDNIKRFATWDNKFVIFGEYLPKKDRGTTAQIELFSCGYVQLKNEKRKTILERIEYFTRPFCLIQISLLSALLFIMGLLSFRKGIRVAR